MKSCPFFKITTVIHAHEEARIAKLTSSILRLTSNVLRLIPAFLRRSKYQSKIPPEKNSPPVWSRKGKKFLILIVICQSEMRSGRNGLDLLTHIRFTDKDNSALLF